MGNGQSSPAGAHAHPPAVKVQTSHREHRRSPSPAAQQRTRKKSLELPDLARLSFTNSSSTSPASQQGANGGSNGSSPRTATTGRPLVSVLGRKRPSPLAPNLMTSPLSPISPQPTPAHARSTSHNPYFPPTTSSSNQVSAEASPIDIPQTPQQVQSPALPAYDRMTYDPQSRRTSEAATVPTPVPILSSSTNRKASASDEGSTQAAPKKARIADEPPSVVPAQQSAPTPSTNPTSPSSQHKRQQPSVGGADEDNTIRSSLPSGGDEYPPPTSLSSSSSANPPSQANHVNSSAGMLGLSMGPSSDAQHRPSSTTSTAPKSTLREEVVQVEGKEEGVPTIINWTGGGKEVYVCGTFAKNWKERLKMSKSTHDFTLVLNLPPGPHRLKFIVDETWRCSDDLANATDADGSLVNYIEVEPKRKDGDAPGWSSEWDAHLGDDSDDDSLWTTEIPLALTHAQSIEEAHLTKIAALPPANRQPGSAALQNPPGLPTPPGLPRHLEKVILNNPPKDGGQVGAAAGSSGSSAAEKMAGGACWTATPDDNSILPIPNHVVLNHLTASAIRNGVLAVGTTTRYKRKYISTLLYKPVEL